MAGTIKMPTTVKAAQSKSTSSSPVASSRTSMGIASPSGPNSTMPSGMAAVTTICSRLNIRPCMSDWIRSCSSTVSAELKKGTNTPVTRITAR